MKTYKTNSDENENVKAFVKQNGLKEASKNSVSYEYGIFVYDGNSEAIFKAYINCIGVAKKIVVFAKNGKKIELNTYNHSSTTTNELVKFLKEQQEETTEVKETKDAKTVKK